jgi:hypothetical protein
MAGKVLVAHFQRHEFVEHAVLGPARHGHDLAHPDTAGQLAHRRQAPAGIPRQHFVLVRARAVEAAELDAGTQAGLRIAPLRLGAVGLCLVGEDIHALADSHREHLLFFRRQRGARLTGRRVRKRVSIIGTE